jgi:hypothetical protein
MAMYGNLDQVFPGMIEGREHNIESRIVKPVAGIQYGSAVFYDAADQEGAYAPDSTDASLLFAGVALNSLRADAKAGIANSYTQYDTINVVNRGEIWVRVPDAETNTANKPVYLIHLTSDGDYGKFTSTAGTNYDTGCWFKPNPIINGTGTGAPGKYACIEVRGLK